MSEPTDGAPESKEGEGYLIFAEAYAKWTLKPPVKGLRNLLASEYPDARQVERDQLALSFLTCEILRYIIPSPEDDDKKEPWQL